jgi:hypothetical protein
METMFLDQATKESRQRSTLAAFAFAASVPWVSMFSYASVPQESPPQELLVRDRVAAIVGELASICPVKPVDDKPAFDRCRKALFDDSLFRRSLSPFVLWGRAPGGNINASLEDFRATQFGPEVYSGTYAPMWMFNGKFEIEYVAREKKYRAFVEAGFRNQLNTGDYPYPFWHEPKKWSDYEDANTFVLWLDPQSLKIVQITFMKRAERAAVAQSTKRHMPTFDGKWMWVDDKGQTQPAPTLFQGLFSAQNPHHKRLDETYRKLALNMRDADCMSCHVPNNPDKMKKLVLLQTPIHAASEIERLVKSIKEDRMPVDEFGLGKAMPAHQRKIMLEDAEAFRAAVAAARAWEAASAPNRSAASIGAGALGNRASGISGGSDNSP